MNHKELEIEVGEQMVDEKLQDIKKSLSQMGKKWRRKRKIRLIFKK